MRSRSALIALAATLALVGCDLAGSNDAVSGYWEGTSEFKADTVLAAHNVRIKADYRMTFGFDLTLDDGLVVGRIKGRREGWLIFREAGFPADTIRFSEGVVIADHQAFGTFIEPELEVDVPDGPYEEDMWTFDVIGSTAETNDYIRNLWTFTRSDGEPFDYGIHSDETFRMRQQDRPEDEPGEGGVETLEGQRWRAALRALEAAH